MIINGMLTDKMQKQQPRLFREKESLIKNLKTMQILKENNLS